MFLVLIFILISAKLTSYKSDLELYKSIESDMKALKLPAKPEDSPVWQAIDAAYPTDIEVPHTPIMHTYGPT